MYNYDIEMLYEPTMLIWSFAGAFLGDFVLGDQVLDYLLAVVRIRHFVIAIIYYVPSGYPAFYCNGGITIGSGRNHDLFCNFRRPVAYMVLIHVFSFGRLFLLWLRRPRILIVSTIILLIEFHCYCTLNSRKHSRAFS